MKARFVLVALLGAGLAAYLIASAGIESVASAALTVGWSGFALLCACGLAIFPVLGAAWHVLAPDWPWKAFLWGRMVRDSAGEILPFTQFGGFIAGARAAIIHGLSPAVAAASMTVDVTMELMAQLLYVGLGITLFAARAPASSDATSLLETVVIGAALLALGCAVFFLLQRRSVWLSNIVAQRFSGLRTGAGAIASALDAIHRSPLRMAASVVFHLCGWIASGAAGWVAFRLAGAHVDLGTALALESIVYGIRSAAVIVPNALGVQEAAYALLSPLVGIPPHVALAVSLLKRARDIAVGAPILLAWQASEGQRALAAE